MFCGEYTRRLEEGGRICLPARFRTEFSDRKIVVIGVGDHVEIWSTNAWRKEKKKTKIKEEKWHSVVYAVQRILNTVMRLAAIRLRGWKSRLISAQSMLK